MKKLLAGLLLLISTAAQADRFEDKFVAVFMNSATEEKFGQVPIDRRLIAEAINRLKSAGARAVIIKFFLDLPENEHSDKKLAESMEGFPVVLQARIENGAKSPNPLQDRFTLTQELEASISGRSGWIPTLQLAENAKDVCFIDFEGFPLPGIEEYREKAVKSLFLCALELAVNASAKITAGSKVEIGHLSYELDSLNRFSEIMPPSKKFEYIPFNEILENDNYVEKVQGKVVIIGYTGLKIHKIKTEFGEISAHELFVRTLHSLYESGI